MKYAYLSVSLSVHKSQSTSDASKRRLHHSETCNHRHCTPQIHTITSAHIRHLHTCTRRMNLHILHRLSIMKCECRMNMSDPPWIIITCVCSVE